jgi:hypothetical protein
VLENEIDTVKVEAWRVNNIKERVGSYLDINICETRLDNMYHIRVCSLERIRCDLVPTHLFFVTWFFKFNEIIPRGSDGNG